MFKWFKRKNAQAVEDKEKGTSKFNADDVSVEVEGKKITVAELEKALMDEEAEEKEHEPMSMDESVTLANGKEYKVGDLVANWKARQAKKNAISRGDAENLFEEYSKEKGGADGEAFFDNPDLLTPQTISAWLKGKGKEQGDVNAIIGVWKSLLQNSKKNSILNALDFGDGKSEADARKKLKEMNYSDEEAETAIKTKKEDQAEADKKKNAAEAEEKEKADKEAKDKEEAVKKENAKKTGLKSFNELHNARNNFAPEGSRAPVSAKGPAERAAEWKKKNSRKAE